MHDESSNQPGPSGQTAEPGNPARRNFMKTSALASLAGAAGLALAA
ncbi:twin-arginine translocation signal domain-containing protein, partial [Rhodanobacter denitrificans]|nr:twin-arginine translocation signal domain-containing protein [Rhodanobacter denitrificans]